MSRAFETGLSSSEKMGLDEDVAYKMLAVANRLGLINATNVAIVLPIFVYLLHGVIPDQVLWWAFAAQVVNVVVAFGGYGFWFFEKHRVKPEHLSRWQALIGVVLTVGGASWAVGPCLLAPVATGLDIALGVGILLTVCAIIANTASGQPWAMTGFLLAAIGPLVVVIWHIGSDQSHLLALVLLAGFIIMVVGGFTAARDQKAQFKAQALLRQAIQEAGAARELAESTSLAKSRFLANMSHELRSPLNAVIGAAQLLKADGGDAGSQEQLVDAIQRSGKNLLGLIENILDISRIEAGEFHLSPGDFHLTDCVDTALATAALAAQTKGLALACIVEPGLQPWRYGDALRLRQILLNLLGNAIKFTPAGDITLRVQRGQTDNVVHITLTDTGVGISAASLPIIFEPFRQADDGASRRFGGSGLGLSIVQQLVVAMGGAISVQSQLGNGTCFDIDLNLPPAKSVPEQPESLGVAIAYFEPHEPSAQALDAQLNALGCEGRRVRSADELRRWLVSRSPQDGSPWLLLACDSPQALNVLEGAVDLVEPDCVIGMTRGDAIGKETVKNLLKLPRNIVKPVLRTALVSRLGTVRRGPSAAPMTVPAELGLIRSGATAAARVIRVLVVEDDALNQLIVCRLLSHGGYETLAASDGAQALELVASQSFDLVLMDWQMPDMDGLEVTRRLRAGQSGAAGMDMPIVALTANAFAEDRAACLAAGMNDFLTKPVQAELLMNTVKRWTKRVALEPEAPVHRHPESIKSDTRPPAFDPSVIAALPMVADGTEPHYAAELMGMFLDSLAQTLEDIEKSIATKDAVKLRRVVHSLKSSSATVGAMELAALAETHENQLRQGHEAVPELPRIMSLAVARFRQAVEPVSGSNVVAESSP